MNPYSGMIPSWIGMISANANMPKTAPESFEPRRASAYPAGAATTTRMATTAAVVSTLLTSAWENDTVPPPASVQARSTLPRVGSPGGRSADSPRASGPRSTVVSTR